MAYDRSDDSRRGRGSRALQRSLASGAFQHGHIRVDEHRVTVWYVFNVHALFHAYHVTRTCVRDQRLTHYLNRGMVKIFPYLTFNKGIHARKRRRHSVLPRPSFYPQFRSGAAIPIVFNGTNHAKPAFPCLREYCRNDVQVSMLRSARLFQDGIAIKLAMRRRVIATVK